MLEFNRLRVDQKDGSVVEYRIESGQVEARAVRNGAVESPWRRLTPEKLRSQVMAGTVLSRWLRGRMGIHQLVRACVQDPPFLIDRDREGPLESDRKAA
jgi:hypothetical protein